MDIALLLILIILIGLGFYSVRHRGERLHRRPGPHAHAMYQGRLKPSAIVRTSPGIVSMPLSADVEEQLPQLDDLKAQSAVNDTDDQARQKRF